jgi:hypothetical protein
MIRIGNCPLRAVAPSTLCRPSRHPPARHENHPPAFMRRSQSHLAADGKGVSGCHPL